MSNWWIWVTGIVVLAVAGFGTAYLPRWRARAGSRAVAWSTAAAAIECAAVSRDAVTVRVIEAEQLLSRAETIAAGRGGRAAAQAAARYAQRADELWRAAHDG